jgi:glycosyltransferase involved in cell wall biosynthesis
MNEIKMKNFKFIFVANLDEFLYKLRVPLANSLRKKGVEVVMVCPPGKSIKKINKEGFKVILWPIERKSLNPFLEIKSLLSLFKIYLKEKPILVHHFTIKPNLYGTIAAYLTGVPHIVNSWTGLGFVFSENKHAKKILKILTPIMRMFRYSKKIWTVFLNEGDRKKFLNLRFVTKSQTAIIPEGINTSKFYPKHKNKNKVPIVLMASRLIKEKGVEEYVNAARIIKNKKIKAKFWLAGAIDPGNPNSISLENLQKWQKEKIIKWLGNCNYKFMPNLLNRVDIAVLPTYYMEGTPMFLIEAASTGLPLVATNIPGCRVIVKHKINGFLVPPKDSKALALAIEKLIKNPSLRKKMGKASREIAIKKFDQQKIINKYLIFYKKILKNEN